MTSRRNFLTGAATMVGAAAVTRAGAAAIPEAPVQDSAATVPPPPPPNGRPYHPVVTLNGWSLPWRMKDGVKEFHLVAEPVVREIAPGMKANLWGYNGQSPGPTIEVVEGDRVRIFVTNKLPEVTSVHWHGQFLPNGMDGVAGLNQPAIAPGKTYVYEFVARYAGTFMYHPHADEMAQIGMGMMGAWITHPKDPRQHAVDRDFVFLLNAYDIDPGSYTPNVNTMLDFNIWTINSRAFPGTAPMVVRKDDRVRIRIGNLSMTNHPFHIHGHRFEITGTDGGWIAPAARWPEVTVDIGVGQMRAIEFVADAPGDWAFHCHKSHHTMNAMGHAVPNLIGVDQRGVARKINDLVPGYMVMGDKGGAMGSMKMPLPENTLPMMDGQGPFGPIEMGGMFTMIKVREGLARGDYQDPGWYKYPAGTVAREWTGAAPDAVRAPATPAAPGEPVARVKRGGGHGGH
jgi:FtsP/CotA-like multicopper oxidase with cupredoxin domain